MLKISEHFSFEEATFSDTAVRWGIKNEPDPDQWAAMSRAAEGMEMVRTLLKQPILVNSWLRIEPLEKLVARKDYEGWCIKRGFTADEESWDVYFARKAHPKGYAVDFRCPKFGTPLAICKFLVTTDLKWNQLIQEGTWVHIDFSPAMKMDVKTAGFGASGVPTYSQGLV
jgi:hypothetical protein